MGSAYEGDRDFLAKLEASGPAVHNRVGALTVTVVTSASRTRTKSLYPDVASSVCLTQP